MWQVVLTLRLMNSLSRKINNDLERALEDGTFQELVDYFGEPEIDLHLD